MISDKPIAVVLPAGGSGLRMGGPVPKQFLQIGHKPLFEYSVNRLCTYPGIGFVVLVLPPNFLTQYEGLCASYKNLILTAGGDTRWQSVRNGVQVLPPGIHGVLIHDVARPFIPKSVVQTCIESLMAGKNVITACRATDTIKQVDGSCVVNTLDRRAIIQVQTPQAILHADLIDVYQKIDKDQIPHSLATDEAGLLEFAGFKVHWVEGSPWLKKVTTAEDMVWAEWVAGLLLSGKLTLDD